MNWESIIISSKPSKVVKDTLSLNKSECKHIGIIPIHWDTLNIHKKNNEYYKNKKYFKEYNQENETNKDNEIEIINTTKNKLLITRNFYYKKNKENKKTKENKDKDIFPIYKFPEDLPFSLREIKNKIGEWLCQEGFSNLDKDKDKDENSFEIYRIYKMTGFHLFLVLLNKKQIFDDNDNNWYIDSGIEILNIEDKEIVNPFMKISQSKFNTKKIYDSNYIWNRKIIGDIIPYEIKWEEIIATFANLIDTNANKNLNLYFTPNIIDNNTNSYNVISNLSKSISEPASDI
jgi:hypothetical protein